MSGSSSEQKSVKALYICYFGLREPLVQSQVLPYLREIAAGGTAVMLLTFEPQPFRSWPKGERERWRQALTSDGIRWVARRYHRWPSLPATLYDILVGAGVILWAIHVWKAHILHARGHVPLAMAWMARFGSSCRILFDLRGFVADEYVEAGHWDQESWRYRAMKRLERHGLRYADHIVVLTNRARAWMLDQRVATRERITVIPCCVDVARFSRVEQSQDQGTRPFQVIYAGSVTGLYQLETMARFFVLLQRYRPSAEWRILTQAPSQEVSTRLQSVGVASAACRIEAVVPADMPAALSEASLGLSFIRPSWSKLASCPTKIPEYLAAGIPVVCGSGMGDMDQFLAEEGVGVIVREYDDASICEAIEQALRLTDDPAIGERCRTAARRVFDLREVGGPRYRETYQTLSQEANPTVRIGSAVLPGDAG